jgi:hypothetical protein
LEAKVVGNDTAALDSLRKLILLLLFISLI